MRIPNAMPAPNPSAGILRRRSLFVGVEPGEIDSPNVSVFRWQRTMICPGEPVHSFPGQGQLDCPTAIPITVVVHGAVDEHRRLFMGKMPVKVPQASPARVAGETNAVEGRQGRTLKLRRSGEPALFVSVLPNKES